MATIKDVADKAGLSVSTVSRYLNNHPYISEEKRKKIRRAMEELHYIPSAVATGLRSNKSHMIGVLVSRITNPFFTYLVDAIESISKEKGYRVLVVQTYDDSEAEADFFNLINAKVLDGAIVCSLEKKENMINAYQEHSRIVLCNEYLDNCEVPQVYLNDEEETESAVAYLINQGHQKIAFSTGGSFQLEGHGKRRNFGYLKTMKNAGLEINEGFIFTNNHTIQDGRNIAKKIMALPSEDRPTALFSGSDEIAAGVEAELLANGISIPKDFAILGYDDQPIASLLPVPLTTIRQPVDLLGKEAVNSLISMINGNQPKNKKLKLEFIKRESA